MSRQHALWVGEEMSRDSDMCWLFIKVSEEKVKGKDDEWVDEGKGKGKKKNLRWGKRND